MPLLAQVESWAMPLVQLGVSGVVLLWFMFRCEARMNDLRDSMDTLAKAHLVSIIANQEASKAVRDQAEQLMRDLEERGQRRGKR